VQELLALLDWKRRVAELYAEVRAAADPEAGWRRWREVRDELFRTHPQSPSPGYDRLRYFDYDPALRLTGEVEDAEPERRAIGASGGETVTFVRFGRVRFELGGESRTLDLFWLEGYGGGLFLPLADATSGNETYGGGRYLLDTVKGADLGGGDTSLVLDFNFAYHPSCTYDPRWSCPLAPEGNRITTPLEAGEQLPPGGSWY
jgi:uncharacterized protein (DUF1684 family)